MRPNVVLVGTLLVAGCDFTPGTSQSVCEAMCAWAIACHQDERDVDGAALRDACLDATYRVDGTCEEADLGALSFAGFEELTPCISAVDERRRAMECDPFTGSGAAIRSGTAPAQCIGAGRDAGAVFDAARDATEETGSALCGRFADGLCAATATCIAASPTGTLPAEGAGVVEEACTTGLREVFTTSCREGGRFSADLVDNLARDGARACLADDLGATSCEGLVAGDFDPLCVEAFASEQERRDVAEALATIVDAYTSSTMP
ncbi:MAG: hypothetical protein AAF602_07855 [Myxococcota bacterium]